MASNSGLISSFAISKLISCLNSSINNEKVTRGLQNVILVKGTFIIFLNTFAVRGAILL